MKNLFLIILAVISYAAFVNAADAVAVGDSVTYVKAYQPSDVRWVFTNKSSISSAKDTFAADLNKKIFGPYELTNKTNKGGGPMVKGFQIYCAAVGGSADTLIGYYQLIPALGTTGIPTFSDTTAGGWVAACTTSSDVGVNKYIDLTSKAGSFMFWRWMSRSATAVYLLGNAGFGFKDGATFCREIE